MTRLKYEPHVYIAARSNRAGMTNVMESRQRRVQCWQQRTLDQYVKTHVVPWAIMLTWSDKWQALKSALDYEQGTVTSDIYVSTVYYSSESYALPIRTLWSTHHVVAYQNLVAYYRTMLKQGQRPRLIN